MKFNFTKTNIPGLTIIEPQVGEDARGTYSEIYKASDFRKAGIKDVFVQENRSVSRRHVLRGLRYQRPPYAQARLVRCGRGSIYEAVVDMRPGSSSRLKSFGIELSDANNLMLYVPAGFAHGFVALTDGSEVIYKCSKEYNPAYQSDLRWNDPVFGIKWPVKNPILSAKDSALPYTQEKPKG